MNSALSLLLSRSFTQNPPPLQQAALISMIFRTLRTECDFAQMATLERKSSQFSNRSLFSSSQADEALPSEHRSSVVEASSDSPSLMRVPLTEALMQSHPDEFKQATEVPFLRQAGRGKVSKLQLSRWLSQDRLYAETYICFISSLLARVSLPYAYVSDKSKSLRWRIINLLSGALQNIHREIDFFTSTADKYGLTLNEPFNDGQEPPFLPEEATRQYIDLFRSFYNDTTLPLIEGMVILWATEKCYHSAWTYASQFTEEVSTKSPTSDADGGALREALIPNWTSDEFGDFVDQIAELTDLLADREQAGRKMEVHKAVWLHVLDIEKRFWPVMEDSK